MVEKTSTTVGIELGKLRESFGTGALTRAEYYLKMLAVLAEARSGLVEEHEVETAAAEALWQARQRLWVKAEEIEEADRLAEERDDERRLQGE